MRSHAQNNGTKATGVSSHAEGASTEANGMSSHAQGNSTKANGSYSHASGSGTIADGYAQTVIGIYNTAQGAVNSKALTDYAFIIGNGANNNQRSNALGIKWDGTFTFANGTEITPDEFTQMKSGGSSGGAKNIVDGSANGSVRTVDSTEEDENYTIGYCAFSSGASTKAGGMFSHAEGSNTNASGSSSHAEGSFTTANGNYSHAEGYQTTASEEYSHAEGHETTASGNSSHAEGHETTARGSYSHAEGYQTTARGGYSHAEGFNTIAYSGYQHVQGKFNIQDENGDYAFIIGNGTNAGARSNALAIKWDGTFVFANGTEISPAQFTSLLALLDSKE